MTNIKIINNIFEGGWGGIVLASNNLPTNTIVSSNSFIDQLSYGAVFIKTTDIDFSSNSISSTSTGSDYSALSMSGVDDFQVYNNRFVISDDGGLGIDIGNFIDRCFNGKIYNNFITFHDLNDDASGRAIKIENVENIDIIYNSIYLAEPLQNANFTGITIGATVSTPNQNINIVNNNINANNGQTLRLSSTTNLDAISQLNFNNLFSDGSIFATVSLLFYDDLADWQSAYGWDTNSIAVDPEFASATDLHIYNTALNGTGTPWPGIDQDIDGDTRDATNPDIGADESIFSSTESSLKNNDIEITLSPNPSANLVTINHSIPIKSVQLIDLSGRVIFTKHFPETSLLDISDLINGYYILRFEFESGIITSRKLLVQKNE